MADEPVSGEPVSEARFPANREKNREFFDFGPFSRATVLKVVCNSGGYERIPYAAEQGNNSLDLGIVFPGTGNNYKAGPAETAGSLDVGWAPPARQLLRGAPLSIHPESWYCDARDSVTSSSPDHNMVIDEVTTGLALHPSKW